MNRVTKELKQRRVLEAGIMPETTKAPLSGHSSLFLADSNSTSNTDESWHGKIIIKQGVGKLTLQGDLKR